MKVIGNTRPVTMRGYMTAATATSVIVIGYMIAITVAGHMTPVR